MTDPLESRARGLGELAFANGDPDLQRGWADYVKAERAELEKVFPLAGVVGLSRFKELQSDTDISRRSPAKALV